MDREEGLLHERQLLDCRWSWQVCYSCDMPQILHEWKAQSEGSLSGQLHAVWMSSPLKLSSQE